MKIFIIMLYFFRFSFLKNDILLNSLFIMLFFSKGALSVGGTFGLDVGRKKSFKILDTRVNTRVMGFYSVFRKTAGLTESR